MLDSVLSVSSASNSLELNSRYSGSGVAVHAELPVRILLGGGAVGRWEWGVAFLPLLRIVSNNL